MARNKGRKILFIRKHRTKENRSSRAPSGIGYREQIVVKESLSRLESWVITINLVIQKHLHATPVVEFAAMLAEPSREGGDALTGSCRSHRLERADREARAQNGAENRGRTIRTDDLVVSFVDNKQVRLELCTIRRDRTDHMRIDCRDGGIDDFEV